MTDDEVLGGVLRRIIRDLPGIDPDEHGCTVIDAVVFLTPEEIEVCRRV